MTGKNLKTIMGVGLAAMALTVTSALALPAVTQAQTTTQTPATTTATTTERRGGPGELLGKMGKMGGANDTYLAEALGITADELTAAQEKAQTAAIDKALADGLITQAQADALKNGTGLGRGRGGLGGLLLGNESALDSEALLADALGITTTELQAAQDKAYDASLAAAVADGNMTQAQADLMKAQRAVANYIETNDVYAQVLKDAVSDGAITQAQADALTAAQGTRGGFGGFGGMKGFDGMGGMRGGRH